MQQHNGRVGGGDPSTLTPLKNRLGGSAGYGSPPGVQKIKCRENHKSVEFYQGSDASEQGPGSQVPITVRPHQVLQLRTKRPFQSRYVRQHQELQFTQTKHTLPPTEQRRITGTQR